MAASRGDAKFADFTPRAHGNANATPLGFLRAARRKVDDLSHGLGWDSEYDRDVFDLRRVGIHSRARRVRFDGLPQPWLRMLVKRWARWKQSKEVSPVHIAWSVTHLTRFAVFLAESTAPSSLAGLDRDAIERFNAHIAADGSSIRSRRLSLGALARFLLAIRHHRWESTLPAGAVVHPEDYPRLAPAPPRALSEAVMRQQLENEDNLARFTDPMERLFTMILMRNAGRTRRYCCRAARPTRTGACRCR
ncbi:hypothetical protein [Amycolatopsis nalaikhensis]|uniref:Core-binding (CB) domain-containing protein n=1 Tax=Amycolatopsis nalaikhensis TaxID=715472 RepID=A0ABY8X8Y5_9PSEU|nr:hypothetical protein [Amycolatopsis sp. 2-2]WIV52854.1 hypothetical protein QP939_28335 [Amycolatopsis sp. 2-2]